uniref:SCAN box domain-containing protein n=1 Tax=Knipowitschia caucasica TaxID=637954 RepID=A0AAV2LQG7_KNICA
MHSLLPRPLRLQHIFGFRRNAQAATLKRLLEAHILDFRPLVALESWYLQTSVRQRGRWVFPGMRKGMLDPSGDTSVIQKFHRSNPAALLTKFDISPETYRQRFRATGVPAGETPTETYHRLRGLYRRWIRPDILSKDAIGELIVLEQLLCVLPPDVRMWVKEHNLEDGLTAAKLALQYQNAHRGFTRFPSSSHRPAPPPGPPSAPPPRPTQDVRGTNFQSAPGREFILETDHRALTWINTMKDHNARLSRWYLSLQPFKFTVRHRKGTANVFADYLSRLPNLGNLGKGKNSVTE